MRSLSVRVSELLLRVKHYDRNAYNYYKNKYSGRKNYKILLNKLKIKLNKIKLERNKITARKKIENFENNNSGKLITINNRTFKLNSGSVFECQEVFNKKKKIYKNVLNNISNLDVYFSTLSWRLNSNFIDADNKTRLILKKLKYLFKQKNIKVFWSIHHKIIKSTNKITWYNVHIHFLSDCDINSYKKNFETIINEFDEIQFKSFFKSSKVENKIASVKYMLKHQLVASRKKKDENKINSYREKLKIESQLIRKRNYGSSFKDDKLNKQLILSLYVLYVYYKLLKVKNCKY